MVDGETRWRGTGTTWSCPAEGDCQWLGGCVADEQRWMAMVVAEVEMDVEWHGGDVRWEREATWFGGWHDG